MTTRALLPDQLLAAEIASAPASRVVELRIPHVTAEEAWQLFADTEALNRALGSPEIDVCNIPVRPGLSRRLMTTRGARKITYEEEHYQWERGAWVGGRRFFLDGPLERFVFLFSQRPHPEGAISELRIGFWGREGDEAARGAAAGLAAGLEALQDRLLVAHRSGPPTLLARAPPGHVDPVQLRVLGATLAASGEAPDTVAALIRHLTEGTDQELEHLAPLKLARDWGHDPEQVIDTFIRAARLGMLLPRWSVACPSCSGPKGAHRDVAELARTAAHCEDCNISFDADPARNMALTFMPAPEVRRLEPTFVCVAGPSRTPHVWAQAYVPPGEVLQLARESTVRGGLWLSAPAIGAALRLTGPGRFALREVGAPQRLEERAPLEVANETGERLRIRLEDREVPDTFLLGSAVLERPRFQALFGADQWQFLAAMSRAWQVEFGLSSPAPRPPGAERRWDLIIVGAGPGGEAAALRAARLGKRVALVEARPHFGGPSGLGSKAMREAVREIVAWAGTGAHGAGFADPAKRFVRVRALFEQRFGSLRRYVASLQMQEVLQRLARAGVSLHHAAASFDADGSLRLEPTSGEPPYNLRATHYVLATGSRPARPASIPFDGAHVLDAEAMSELDRLPRTLTIVGAGVIGCEFAAIMAALGVKVTLLSAGRPFYPFLDRELADAGMTELIRAGIRIVPHAVKEVALHGAEVTATLDEGTSIRSEVLLFAEGREGNSEGLGCEAAQVRLAKYGRVEVDPLHRSSNPSVYAIGDLAGPPGLASAAAQQGREVVDRIFSSGAEETATAPLTPTTIWTFPELASVGLTEDAAAKAGTPVSIGRAFYRDLPRGILSGELHGWLKLVCAADDGRLLGVHIIGEEACELVHYGAALIEAGTRLDHLTRSGFSAITFHGLYQAAAEDALQPPPAPLEEAR